MMPRQKIRAENPALEANPAKRRAARRASEAAKKLNATSVRATLGTVKAFRPPYYDGSDEAAGQPCVYKLSSSIYLRSQVSVALDAPRLVIAGPEMSASANRWFPA